MLSLVSELSTRPRLRDAPQGEDDDVDSGPVADESLIVVDTNPAALSADLCITAGPFTDQSAAEKLQTWLTTRAVRILMETKAVRTRQLYWIYLEPVDDEQAQQQLQDLQNKGVQDYLLIRRGGLTNAISLGLFSSLEAVNNRLAEMERQGYTPVVIPRFETRDERWLRAELGAGFEDYTAVPADVIGEVKIGPIPCTAVAQIKDGD